MSFAITTKLVCVFVFPSADCWFSDAAAHFIYMIDEHSSLVLECQTFAPL